MSGPCSAHRADSGEPCKNRALAGLNVCYYHGGAAPQVRAAGKRRVAEAKAEMSVERALDKARAMLSVPIDADPTEALLEALWRASSLVSYWQAARDELMGDAPLSATATGALEKHTLMRAYEDAVDRLARIAKLAVDAGVAERQVRLTEELGRLVSARMQAAMDDLDLTPEQRARVPAIMKARLELLPGENDG